MSRFTKRLFLLLDRVTNWLTFLDEKTKLPVDANKRAKPIIDIATGESEDAILTSDGKNAAAVALGRLGGFKEGKLG